MRWFNTSCVMTEWSRAISAEDSALTEYGIFPIGISLPGSGETLMSEGGGGMTNLIAGAASSAIGSVGDADPSWTACVLGVVIFRTALFGF
jgi:hypothetical protein